MRKESDTALVLASEGAINLAGVTTDAAFLEVWLSQYRAGTAGVYAKAAREFLAFVGKPLAEVRLPDLTAYAKSIESLSPATQRLRIMVVKALLGYAQRTGYLRWNVGAAVKAPKAPSALAGRIMGEMEVYALVGAAKRYLDKVLIKTLYATGLRVSELCGLDWEHLRIDDRGGVLEVVGKGQKVRYVRLPKPLVQELLCLRTGKRTGPIFVSQKGTRLTRRAVRDIVAKAAKRAGIDRAVSPHWLRHAHATHALSRGVNVQKVSAVLGHSSLAVTSRYLHADPEECIGDALMFWKR